MHKRRNVNSSPEMDEEAAPFLADDPEILVEEKSDKKGKSNIKRTVIIVTYLVYAFTCRIALVSGCFVIMTDLLFGTKIWIGKEDKASILDPALVQGVTVATIATGGYTADTLIDSLLDPGRWTPDKILVVVDDCRPPPDEAKSLHAVVARTHSAIEAKFLKTTLFEQVETQRALFLDSDVVALRPLLDLFEEISTWDPLCDAYMQVYPFVPLARHDSWLDILARKIVMALDEEFDYWNSGMIYLDRDFSADFLKAWGEKISSGRFKKDQWALRELLETSDYNLCALPEVMRFQAAFATNVNQYFFNYTFSHETSSSSDRYKTKCEEKDN